MATKVLVFESDPAFAGELRNEFGKLGCSTVVVDDGNLGLQQAVSDKPDLILLAIELPRMNGFSVCNKLKKDPALKDVPLIIMSTDSSDETFEQHKKLRTRADDYVHKPIAFGELLQHIQGFLGISTPVHDSDDAIVIEDEIEVGTTDYVADDGELSTQVSYVEPSSPRTDAVDADVDAFAESAFGRLTDRSVHPPANGAYTPEPASPARSTSMRPSSVRQSSMPPAAPTGVDVAEYDRVVHELARVKVRFDEMDRAFEDAREEVESLRSQAAESEQRAREIEELKSKMASAKGGAISSRDFLDLREALNKKDKEILTLKELIAKKDRHLVEAQDRSLAAERAHSELDDRLLALEREISETREKNESLSLDRDLAKKASDDFRNRLEKVRAESEAKERQLADLRSRHADELRAAEEIASAMRSELDQTLANERAEHARALDQSEERRKADIDGFKREFDGVLTEARSEWELERTRAHADAERRQQEALTRLRNELEAKGAIDVAEASERVEKLGQELASAREEVASLRGENDELERRIAAGDARLATLDTEIARVQLELVDVKQRLNVQLARGEKAQAKWQADRQSLERAKDALAIVLAQVEEVEERPID